MEKTKVQIAENLALRELLYHIPFHQPKHPCWVWTRQKNENGYGVITFDGFHFSVHRLSFRHFKGLIPVGMLVMHECDYPPCWNPNHLFLGTQQDNVDDAIRKGRRKIREAIETSWAWLTPPPTATKPQRQQWDETLLRFAQGRKS